MPCGIGSWGGQRLSMADYVAGWGPGARRTPPEGASVGYALRTAEKSIVRVLLGGKALVTVREISVLTITETPGRSTIELT